MLADNETYRQTESDMSTPWSHEPALDYGMLVRHMQTIPPDWLNIILAETARRCLAEAGEATAPLRVDSSGVGTKRLNGPARRSRILSRHAKRYTCSTVWQPFWAYR
ncbi:MAG: hypothetical protein F4202_00245 [Cenarchaeum sp. SB0677_bin_16]|nr:hypothetical protein [Cenarchaeum sp. SB0677_bin_16]